MRATAVILLLLLAACDGEAKRQSATVDTAVALPYDTFSGRTNDSSTTAPPPPDSIMGTKTVPMLAGPTVVFVADSAAGNAIYHGKGRCFTCHGSQADGMATLGPSLMDTTWLHGNGSLVMIEQTITNGIAAPVVSQIAMPAYGAQLSPAEIRRVASYVYSLSHRGSVIADTAVADTTHPDTTHADSLASLFRLPSDTTTSH